jgi:hypothetical protein
MKLTKYLTALALASTFASAAHAGVIAVVDADGGTFSNAQISATALGDTVASVSGAAIGAMSADSLRSNYDALIFSWYGSSYGPAFWDTLKGYVSVGGGVIFDGAESATSALDGSGITFGTGYFGGDLDVVDHKFTSESTVYAANSHLGDLIASADWNSFITGGAGVNGVYADFGTGHAIVTSTDYFYHADTPTEQAFLTEEVKYVTSGSEVPEPVSLALMGVGLFGVAMARRKKA